MDACIMHQQYISKLSTGHDAVAASEPRTTSLYVTVCLHLSQLVDKKNIFFPTIMFSDSVKYQNYQHAYE